LPPTHMLSRWFSTICSCFSPSEYEAALLAVDASDNPCLPPEQLPEHEGRKTLVLDLDETLVHSVFKQVPNADLKVNVEVQGR
jgi:RNA polymerase II subunit A small phosphatase-like protein